MGNIIFNYEIGQKIHILEIDRPGRVLARCDRGNMIEYRIVYWLESKRYDEWLTDWEICATVVPGNPP